MRFDLPACRIAVFLSRDLTGKKLLTLGRSHEKEWPLAFAFVKWVSGCLVCCPAYNRTSRG